MFCGVRKKNSLALGRVPKRFKVVRKKREKEREIITKTGETDKFS